MVKAKWSHSIIYLSSTVTQTEANLNPTDLELVTQKEVWYTGSTMFLSLCCNPYADLAPARVRPTSASISSLSSRSILHRHRRCCRSIHWSSSFCASSARHWQNFSYILESTRNARLPDLGCQDDQYKGLRSIFDLAAACWDVRHGANNLRSFLRNRHILPSPTRQSLHQLRN